MKEEATVIISVGGEKTLDEIQPHLWWKHLANKE